MVVGLLDRHGTPSLTRKNARRPALKVGLSVSPCLRFFERIRQEIIFINYSEVDDSTTGATGGRLFNNELARLRARFFLCHFRKLTCCITTAFCNCLFISQDFLAQHSDKTEERCLRSVSKSYIIISIIFIFALQFVIRKQNGPTFVNV